MKKTNWLYILLFSAPAILVLLTTFLDNDLWYILAEGRYIVQRGIYYTDVLSIHQGLAITVQNWASASLFWLIYDYFGEIGIMTLLIGCNLAVCILLYKICDLISDGNKVLSIIIMLLCDSFLSLEYIVTRPQILSFIVLLSLIYVLELYIKKDNWKYLLWIPLLSVFEINFHASLWWMMWLFTLPYIIDSFRCEKLHLQGYRKLPLFIIILISMGLGMLNPYGYKAITFIFTSFGNNLMHSYIAELSSFNFAILFCKVLFGLILLFLLIFAFFRDGHVRVRYLCLMSGTMILGFIAIKGFSSFILVSFFPFAYFFKDKVKKTINIKKPWSTILHYVFMVLALASLGGVFALYARDSKNMILVNKNSEALTILQNIADPNTAVVYSSFNNGGTVEFYGFKAYIDPRAEVFLKVNNKKFDVFNEFYQLELGLIDKDVFIKKYNFTHLLVDNTDIMFNLDNKDYIVIYESNVYGVRLFARRDLFTKEQLKEIERQYELSKSQTPQINPVNR